MAQIKLESVRTDVADPEAAAEQLVSGLAGATPRLVTLFAGRERDHLALNRAVRRRLPAGTRLIGASTSGEVDREGLHRGTVVLGALSGDFEIGLGLGRGLSDDALGAGQAAMAAACAELGTTPPDLVPGRHVGVVIDDGFRFKKEELLLGMLSENPDVLLVGGGASSHEAMGDPSTVRALVHVDGEVTDDATLVALFRTDAPFAALRSHWYEPTGRTLTITRVDASQQRALEIDGQPAAARYAELIGVGIDELEFGLPRGFALMPTALKVGSEYFLRAPWKPLPDGSVLFANLLEEGVVLELMQAGDMGELTRRFFTEEVPRRVRNPQAALLFHCGARSFFAQARGSYEAVSEAFRSAPPCAGFDVYFESYCGFHINTTLTALVFGSSE